MLVLVLVVVAVAGVGTLVAARPFARSAGAMVTEPGSVDAAGRGSNQVDSGAAGASPISTSTTAPPSDPSSTGSGTGSAGDLPATLPADAVVVHVPILMYHYVDAEPPPMGPYADSLTVRTPEFRSQLSHLAAQGYRTLDLAAVYLAMAAGTPYEYKAVAITFDDGGLDNYTVAFPLLKEHGFTATFFIITEEIGRPGYMTWDMVREMAAAGMSIQSHTAFHSDLRSITDKKLRAELAGSRATIEEETGLVPYALCYPAGAYDERAIAAARDAGYLLAVTTKPGKDLDPERIMELPRVRVSPGMGDAAFAETVK